MVDFLIENLAHYDPKSNNSKCKKPFLGYLVKLANILISDKYNSNCELMKYLGKNEEWQEFAKSQLARINEISQSDLGGHNPHKQSFPPKKFEQKDELDDFDMLFIEHRKLNENSEHNFSYSPKNQANQDEFTFNDLQNDLVNLEGGIFSLKYQPEDEDLLDHQFDYLSDQISALNFSDEL